jgi:hypothetical protein
MEPSCAQSSSNSHAPASKVTDQQSPKVVTIFGSPSVPTALDDQYALWLRTFRWDFWVTGTLKEPVTSATMLEIVKTWLLPFHQSYAAVTLPLGPFSKTIHSHMLIGRGADQRRKRRLSDTLLRGSWVRDGHVRVEQFRPSFGGVEYMVAQADDIEILGTPVLYKPRHVRGRRGRLRRK